MPVEPIDHDALWDAGVAAAEIIRNTTDISSLHRRATSENAIANTSAVFLMIHSDLHLEQAATDATTVIAQNVTIIGLLEDIKQEIIDLPGPPA